MAKGLIREALLGAVCLTAGLAGGSFVIDYFLTNLSQRDCYVEDAPRGYVPTPADFGPDCDSVFVRYEDGSGKFFLSHNK